MHPDAAVFARFITRTQKTFDDAFKAWGQQFLRWVDTNDERDKEAPRRRGDVR